MLLQAGNTVKTVNEELGELAPSENGKQTEEYWTKESQKERQKENIEEVAVKQFLNFTSLLEIQWGEDG